MADHAQSPNGGHAEEGTRRDFLFLTAASVTAFGAASAVWPFVSSMNPSKDVLALSSIEVDVGHIAEGQAITVKWRGKPVFIRHRTAAEITQAQKDDSVEMKDPQPDEKRAIKPEYLVLVGVCTHLGCVPLGHEGPYHGWQCPCHGSIFDTSGRIRQGPAPQNLGVPPYAFLADRELRTDDIGNHLRTNVALKVPYTEEQIAHATEDLRAQADPTSDASTAFEERYPTVKARAYDGDAEHLTEMDALIAYLQMIGTLVDFKAAEAQEQAQEPSK